MDSNEEVIKKRVVEVASPSGVSKSTVIIIVVLVVIVAATVVYLVNRNANRLVDMASATQSPQTIVPQPVPAPAPVIIQPAAPIQPATVIIQQPSQSSIEKQLTSSNEDANLLNLASKKLDEDLELGGVVTTVNDARAVLTGAVGSEAAKAKAEQLVKAVRGMKSVANRIVVAG